MNETPPLTPRRKFLAACVVLIQACIAALIAVPFVGGLVAPALGQRERQWVSLGKLRDYRVGEPTKAVVRYTKRDGWLEQEVETLVYVMRRSDGTFTVYSSTCTHLGCRVRWVPEGRRFRCPCHGGVYDEGGVVIAGPPPSSLIRPPTRVEGGMLLVEQA